LNPKNQTKVLPGKLGDKGQGREMMKMVSAVGPDISPVLRAKILFTYQKGSWPVFFPSPSDNSSFPSPSDNISFPSPSDNISFPSPRDNKIIIKKMKI